MDVSGSPACTELPFASDPSSLEQPLASDSSVGFPEQDSREKLVASLHLSYCYRALMDVLESCNQDGDYSEEKTGFYCFLRSSALFRYGVYSWPYNTIPLCEFHKDNFYVGPTEKSVGNPVLAFVCREGVVVAVQDSVDGAAGGFIKFNKSVFGYVTGDAAACKKVLDNLDVQSMPVSAEDIVGKLHKTVNMDGLSGILVAGWDAKFDAVLYCLDADREPRQGLIFCCSCSDRAAHRLTYWNFIRMSLDEAAKVARFLMAYTVACKGQHHGFDYDIMNDEDGDYMKNIGTSVVVYRIGLSTEVQSAAGGGSWSNVMVETTDKDTK